MVLRIEDVKSVSRQGRTSATFSPRRLRKILPAKVFEKVVETLAKRFVPYLCARKTPIQTHDVFKEHKLETRWR